MIRAKPRAGTLAPRATALSYLIFCGRVVVMKIANALWIPVLLALASHLAGQETGDPPSRVARLNYVVGAVSFRPSTVDSWVPATSNYPMTTGDHLWTDAGGSVEIHVGSSAIRLASLAAFSILNLDDRTAQISLSQGAMHVRI